MQHEVTLARLVRAVLLAGGIAAAVGAGPARADSYDWKGAAKEQGLSSRDIEQLGRDKILVGRKEYKQVFEPYYDPDMPIFITSDSLLNAFHVLYEASILRLELANSPRLHKILRRTWGNLETAAANVRGRPELVAVAKRRAQIVLGTALRLLGDEATVGDADVDAIIAAEVQRVTEATATDKPDWLGSPRDTTFLGLDYSRYKPRGFYTKLPALEGYFRTASWLQSIPFRVEKDDELLAVLMLAAASTDVPAEEQASWRQELEGFFGCYREFLGDNDDWDLLVAAKELDGGLRLDLASGDLERIRGELDEKAKREGGPLINDLVAFAPEDPTQMTYLSFRVLSARRTPEAILFGHTTDSRTFEPSGRFPSGLEVCIALGSKHAETLPDDPESQRVIGIIDQHRDLFTGDSLYFDYLACLSTLLGEPDTGAPAFIAGDPWRTKSCQTVLAGWAQARHTWALHAKQSTAMWFDDGEDITRKYPGFVEPNPEFFARMAKMSDDCEVILKAAGAFETEMQAAAADLRELRDFLERRQSLLADDPDYLSNLTAHEQALMLKLPRYVEHVDLENVTRESVERWIDELSAAIDAFDAGKVSPGDRLSRIVRQSDVRLAGRWKGMGRLCEKLQEIAERQLDEAFDSPGTSPFTDAEREWFTAGFGTALAGVLLHEELAQTPPRDDAPQAIDVFYDPFAEDLPYLEVGIGRPRVFYVLYPAGGREILCRGAVLPYYEFRNTTRLDDDEWRQMLATSDRPEQPAWVTPILSRGLTRFQEILVKLGIGAAVVLGAVLTFVVIRRRRRRKAAPAA